MEGWIAAGVLAIIVIALGIFIWRAIPRGPFM